MAEIVKMEPGGCAESDLVAAYLSWKLSEEERTAFEQHFFACESCWHEVELGTELRATFASEAAGTATATQKRSRSGLQLGSWISSTRNG